MAPTLTDGETWMPTHLATPDPVSVAHTASIRRVAVLQAQVMFACNNRCWFCLDRSEGDGEFHGGPPVVPLATIERLLRDHAGSVDAVMFTHGEPTLHPQLADMLKLARELGYAGRGVVSNARKLADRQLARELVDAGANRFVLSIHGGDAATHNASVGKDAFVQAREGLANLVALKVQADLELNSSTVASRLNLDKLFETVEFLLEQGIDHAVINVVRPTGHAAKHFTQVVPRYSEVVAALAPLADLPADRRLRVVMEDIPPCAAGPLTSLVGVLEAWIVPPSDESVTAPLAKSSNFAIPVADGAAATTGVTGDLVKRAECAACIHNSHCWGVWKTYVDAYGWQEFAPVLHTDDLAQSAFERAVNVELSADRVIARLPPQWSLVNWTLDGRRDRLLLDLSDGLQPFVAIVQSSEGARSAYVRAGPWAWSYSSAATPPAAAFAVLGALSAAFAKNGGKS
ncbi:MAG: radical SAM protein [Myxococcales bacterium]|nr:radical SAM protein [Myxococcales bacterium]